MYAHIIALILDLFRDNSAEVGVERSGEDLSFDYC